MPTPHSSLLTCPRCGGPLSRVCAPEHAGLRCANCDAPFPRDSSDFFVDLREAPPGQPRSLLVHEPEDQDSYGSGPFARFSIEAFGSALKSVLAECRPPRIIDVGCGGGEYGLALDGLCDEYYGLEPSDIPPARRLTAPPPAYMTLAHHDPARPFPVRDATADLVMFIASYDHIPNRLEVLADAWRLLVPGGFLLIGMSNYGFWLKRAANRLLRRQGFLHTEHHFCVHTVQSLIDEVTSVEPRANVSRIEAEFVHLPNLPRGLRWLYAHDRAIASANRLLRAVVTRTDRNAGSSMIVLFQKREDGGPVAAGHR